MAGTAPKSPFPLSFVIGVLVAIALSALAFISVVAWRSFRNRHKFEPSNDTIPLPALLEEGMLAQGALDFFCRGPSSRLGGIPTSSAVKADEVAGPPQSQLPSHQRAENGAAQDGLQLLDPQHSIHTNIPLSVDGVHHVEKRAGCTESVRNRTYPGSNGDMIVEIGGSQPLFFPTPPKIILLPQALRMSGGKLSISTVWSQESMSPREKKPVVPLRPLPLLPVPQRISLPCIMTPRSPSLRSTSSLPRSPGQSEFDDY
ncbi:hypothetical protein B0F90DRAFT_1816814 [Multifurca ochricompacta]|uniref:Uncharacterized protein n=1 Tax=Multifurca ochricompacta TaxID=376703 RepID=A0AAD4QP79_9AGAM|nr:hypothetical protein B0F90DRAFT_1816814 [Multifurca ochricompacta]